MESTGVKCKKEQDFDSSSSVIYLTNLGDVGNTINEDSSNDANQQHKLHCLKKKKLIHKSKETSSDTEDSDIQIVEYKSPIEPHTSKNDSSSSEEYQNQLMDPRVQKLWEEHDYYADNESDKDNSEDKYKVILNRPFLLKYR